jgi:hypothetical protein
MLDGTKNITKKSTKLVQSKTKSRPRKKKGCNSSESESESSMSSESGSEIEGDSSEDATTTQYVVDEISNDRQGPNSTIELLVRWSGTDENCEDTYEDTWEPAAHIEKTAGRTVRAYMKRVGAISG